MSADAEEVVQVPSTPPRAGSQSAVSNATHDKSSYASPPALSVSMTPPPSTQTQRFLSPGSHHNAQVSLTTSPSIAARMSGSSSLPSPEKIATAGIDELRTMAQELVGALTDARMSAAHFKLQYTLLSLETREAAQRAEVEHQMTKREVEVLHAVEQRNRNIPIAATRSIQASPQPQVSALTKACKDLEDERNELDDRLQEARKVLDMEKDRAELLAEENVLLKKRIRENREHFTKLKDQSPIYVTPRQAYTTPRRKSYSRFADNTPAHEPFAALLYADQMLSQEPISVPSTPTKANANTARSGHTRGSHSLSSIQLAPIRRPMTSDGYPDSLAPISAPGSQLVYETTDRERHERDSTISVSDDYASGDDVHQSQASSLATDMLRKNPASQESIRQSQDAERSSNLLQTKLFGNVKKSSLPKTGNKRSADTDNESIQSKKAKLKEGLGLGVETWNRAST